MSEKVILCVDDEEIILNALEDELSGQLDNCIIESALGGQEALELIDELTTEKAEIAVVLCDFIMPGMNGDELLIAIHKKLPSTQTIMLTGQSQIEGITQAINHANLFRFIPKPWDKQDLHLTLKFAIGKYEADRQLEHQEKMISQLNKRLEANSSETVEEEKAEFDIMYDQIYFQYFFHSLGEEDKHWVGNALIALILSDGVITKKEVEHVKVILKGDRREDIVMEHLDHLKKMTVPELTALRTTRENAFLIFRNLLLFQATKRGIKEDEEKAIYQIGRLLGLDLSVITELVKITKGRIIFDFKEHKVLETMKSSSANYTGKL
jgi:YesN/AraC family two-component response regulator